MTNDQLTPLEVREIPIVSIGPSGIGGEYQTEIEFSPSKKSRRPNGSDSKDAAAALSFFPRVIWFLRYGPRKIWLLNFRCGWPWSWAIKLVWQVAGIDTNDDL